MAGLRSVGKLGGTIQRGMKVRTTEAIGLVMTEIIMGPGCPLRRRRVKGARAGRSTVPTTVDRMPQQPCLHRQEKEPVTHFLRLRTARSITRILTFLVIRESGGDTKERTRLEPARGIPRSTAMTRTGATSIIDLEMSIEIAIATRDYIRMIDEMNGRAGGLGAGALSLEAAGARGMSATARGTDENVAAAKTSGKKRRRRRKDRGTWKVANCQESLPSA
jgi:hypothetical protein